MKIGLLTLHASNNFGALLQVYATIQVLRRMGHKCEIINLQQKNRFVSFIYNNLLGLNFSIFRGKFLQPQTKRYYAGNDLTELNGKYDCFLVGSDQVWRSSFHKGIALNYFLDFADENILKVSYASSFGISDWKETPELTPTARSLLKRFSAVSVREDSGVRICRDEFGVEAQHVLDPTLLLEDGDYREVMKNVKVSVPSKYCAIFLLAGGFSQLEKEISGLVEKRISCETVSISIPKFRLGKRYFNWKPRKVGEWVYILKNADYVITESFHCVLFALIFQKKFICLANETRGRARLESILNKLGLSERLVERKEVYEDSVMTILQKDINYSKVNQILASLKEESLGFLSNALVMK